MSAVEILLMLSCALSGAFIGWWIGGVSTRRAAKKYGDDWHFKWKWYRYEGWI